MLSIRHLLQAQGHIQTENKELRKGVPCKQKSKVNGSSNTDTRLKKIIINKDFKNHYKRHGRINPRRYNNYKLL